MSEFKTRKFKCTGCGEVRPCYLEVTEQQFYDHNMINNLKCVVDDTNSTGFNWEEVEANGVTTGEKQCNLPVVSKSEERVALHAEVFKLANKLAIAGYGNEAVKMHGICNGML